MRIRTLSLSFVALLGLHLACGGGSTSTPATTNNKIAGTGLVYSDPTGSGWRLVKDASSTPTRLVLNLVGPSGTLTRGVGLNLQAPDGVVFDTFPGGALISDTGIYELGSSVPAATDPVALVGGVKPGNVLSIGIFQKDRAYGAKDSGSPLCQIALKLATTEVPSSGQALPLLVKKAKVVPEDIGATTDDLVTLSQKVRLVDINLAVGTLSAK